MFKKISMTILGILLIYGAVAFAMKLAKKMGRGSILINLSGRGDKDMDYIIEKYGIPD